MNTKFKRSLLAVAVCIGIGIAAISLYSMFAYELPWATQKWGHEKPGPWFFGLIGLAIAGWAAGELFLDRAAERDETESSDSH